MAYVLRRVVAAVVIALVLAALARTGVLHAAEPCAVYLVDPSVAPSAAPEASVAACTVALSDEDRARLDALMAHQADDRSIFVYGVGIVIFLSTVVAVAVSLRR